ncbi:BTB/POZ domain-containing protein 6-B-like [Dendronephthya gigantea]|uniref:BTB/POZ domain-containing protein 6-B-like n=1 Tax=Dendronephthya gigantea TaxID=151771 RepID=UPI0010692C89|nr:BTB/POZ domain-containing protein 6-B-like [Dendronephthya gigantea]
MQKYSICLFTNIQFFARILFQTMALKYHEDWQSSKTTVIERNEYMFDNELMSDVSFVCGESGHRVFHAHKYVLATSSAVFFSMFYGHVAEKESPIRINDTEEKSFEEFLRFLYVEDCEVTAGNAIGIMYLAKKYFISSLAKKCSKVLEENIEPDNVFAVLEQAVKFEQNELEAKCWNIIETKTQECITSEAFCNIRTRTLKTLLEKRKFEIAEVQLFKAVLKWVDSECARQGINTKEDKTARKRILGDIRYEIRFLDMSEHDFAEYVSTSEILTEKERLSIFHKFNGLDVSDFKWPEREVKQHEVKQVRIVGLCRFDNASGSWGYNGNKSDALTLSVNKAVLFHGVRLFGNSGGGQYEVKFTIKNENITGTYTSEQNDEKIWGYDVMLSQAISLLAKEEFTIVATIKGPTSSYGEQGKSQVAVDDIVITFKDAPPGCSPNGTGQERGQFHKIYLSEL